MIQEYLFVSEDNKEEIVNLEFKDVEINISKIGDDSSWVVTYKTEKNNEKTARKLSEIDGFLEKYNPIVLVNQSAEYFNIKLYPLVNSFERKLRKLLYVASVINRDTKGADNIKALEKMELGPLFDLLFTDDDFINQVKKDINNKTWKYTQKEILDLISGIKEDILWDRLLGDNYVLTLRNNFIEVKNSRNDIMHAHNISYQRYKEIKKLYETILLEIDECLENLNANDYVESSETLQSYNEMLANALSNFEEARKNMSVISDFYNQYRANFSPGVSSAFEKLSEFNKNSVFSGQAIKEALKSEEWKNFCGLLDSLRND